jgi:signal transduction histidine kinase
MSKFLDKISSIGINANDGEDTILQKNYLVYHALLMSAGGIIWGALCLIFDRRWQSLVPFGYVFISIINLLYFQYNRNFKIVKSIQTAASLLLPFMIQAFLGGFIASGGVMLWSLIALASSVTYQGNRTIGVWFLMYALLTITLGVLDNVFVDWIKPSDAYQFYILFTVSNIVIISAILIWLFNFIVKGKNEALRKLSKAQVQLIQSEKKATLGTLIAGVAHELNNPAAAVIRASKQLVDINERLENTREKFNSLNLSSKEYNFCKLFIDGILKEQISIESANIIKQLDNESAIEQWIEKKGIKEPWVIAPVLNDNGVSIDKLNVLADGINPSALETVLFWILYTIQTNSLLKEVMEGSDRISKIVVALKNYSYLDQATIKQVNIHEGIENTLIILRNKLKQGITINKYYDSDLPLITAYGSELNQVWTNILDNASDVLKGKGEITIKTTRKNSSVIVEIEDNGTGIPAEIQNRIFDPFFTTKEPGKGTGLGLSTSYGIITEKHHGKISVQSVKGMTRFTIELPIEQ